jgi:hypothetical protein
MGRGEVVPNPSGTPRLITRSQHHSDCCPKEERVLRAPSSRLIAHGAVAVMSKAPNEAQGPSVVALLASHQVSFEAAGLISMEISCRKDPAIRMGEGTVA